MFVAGRLSVSLVELLGVVRVVGVVGVFGLSSSLCLVVLLLFVLSTQGLCCLVSRFSLSASLFVFDLWFVELRFGRGNFAENFGS